jgi:cell wall-associated NlpC family hydrolase
MPKPKALRPAKARSLAWLSICLALSLTVFSVGVSSDYLLAATAKPVVKTQAKKSAKKAVAKKPAKKAAAKKASKAKAAKNKAASKSLASSSSTNPKSSKKSAKTVSYDIKSKDALSQNIEEDLPDKEDLGPQELELIDFSTMTKGLNLNGRLTTATVGSDLLASYGRLPKRVSLNVGDRIAALDYDNAPRSSRYLRMSQGLTNRLLANAYGQTGRPYRSGGRGPATGFDEAGFVMWLFAQEGVKIPAQTDALVAAGQAVARDELRPGDVLVYRSPKENGYDVGVYSGNGNFIHASKKHRGVSEAAAFDTEIGPYFVGGRRFVDDPKAAPLSDEIKTAATNGAVKLALSEMGDNLPKPANIYGSPKKPKSKYKKAKSSRRGGKTKAVSKKYPVKKSSRASKSKK